MKARAHSRSPPPSPGAFSRSGRSFAGSLLAKGLRAALKVEQPLLLQQFLACCAKQAQRCPAVMQAWDKAPGGMSAISSALMREPGRHLFLVRVMCCVQPS